MTIKRAILALLTILAIAQIGLSLNNSFSQPQIGGRLELYQTNLMLHVAEFKSNPTDDFDLNSAVDSLVGADPYSAANQKYQQVREQSVVSRDNFSSQLQQLDTKVLSSEEIQVDNARKNQLTVQVAQLNKFINEIDLKRGILTAVQGKPNEAIAIWQSVVDRIGNTEDSYAQTASLLQQLWQDRSEVTGRSTFRGNLETTPTQNLPSDAVSLINNNLDSWFRYQALAKYDRTNNLTEDLTVLQERELQIATSSVFKLAVISGLPFFGSIFGIILLIFVAVQRLVKKEKSLLATNAGNNWETPWDWEITWQVLIVGFFFITQFVIPLLLGIFNINPVNSSLRIKSLYVLGTYMAMAIGGISVLYLSIKSFFPLPQDWFKFKLIDNWIAWGIGGYLAALPLVLFVSLINQQIWQGQGGRNPLLLLALQAQDKVVLLVFFVTSSIAAPVFEEIMFRGFLLPSLTRYVSVTNAIVISGFIFAVAHLSLSEVLPLATLGIVLGFVYTRSRNLLAPMLIHCLWNSGTLISLFVLGSGV
jgi:membrane protease YdiL (CAAX protease family)